MPSRTRLIQKQNPDCDSRLLVPKIYYKVLNV